MDPGIKSYIFDHAESEFRLPEFSKNLFYKIWDKELKYIILVSMKCGVDLRQKQNRLSLLFGGYLCEVSFFKHNYVERENNLNE